MVVDKPIVVKLVYKYIYIYIYIYIERERERETVFRGPDMCVEHVVMYISR